MRGSRVGRAVPLAFCLALLATGTDVARAEDAVTEKAEEARRIADLVARLKSEDVDERRQAVAEAKREQAPAVTAELVRRIPDADEKVRIAAIAALGARTDTAARKDAAGHLASRLARVTKNEQREERFAALRALHDLAQPSTLKALEGDLALDMEPEELALRLRAIANLPCDEAVETLIKARSSGRGGRTGRGGYGVRMVREAWVYATGQSKPSSDPDAWRSWWGERKPTWDHSEALARRKSEGGGPTARPNDAADGG
jgi:hypothetical protein